VKYVELKKSEELSRCCGAGGGVKGGYPDLALKIARRRLEEAEEAGVEVLVTSCPFCIRNFRDAVKTFGSKLEVKDLAELVSKLT
jgi:heterodisulfide reductase subunit D